MSSVRERYNEAFWRAHHEAWLQSELSLWCAAQGVRQLAGQVQSRAADAGAEGALPARCPKSYP